jgi:hypothetical protein
MAVIHSPETTRRPGVVTRPVRLADGREWGFFLPTLRLIPAFHGMRDETGRSITAVSYRVEANLPLAAQACLDAVMAAGDGVAPEALLRSFLALVAELLLASHDVDPEAVVDLLDLDPREFPRLVDEAFASVRGAER